MQSIKPAVPRGLMTTCMLVITFWGISQARPFLIPLFIAALLALMMAPLVRVMNRYHFPEWSAITLSALLLLLPFFGLGFILFWQGQSFLQDFPTLFASLSKIVGRIAATSLGRRLHLSRDIDIPGLISGLEGSFVQGAQIAVAGLGAILGAGSQVLLVLLFAILMLNSRRHLRLSFEKILAQNMGVKNPRILNDVTILIEQFLLARLLIVIVIGGINILILEVFEVGYAVLLGSFLGILTLVPAVGFIIGIVPPLIVALASGFTFLKTLAMFGCLAVVSLIEGNILTPKMVGGRVNINALTSFVGLFAGGLIWGVWGMFLSIPILGALRIVFNAAPSLRPWGDLLADKPDLLGSHPQRKPETLP